MVRQSGRILTEFQFSRSPVYIGRHADSQVFLTDKRVSRHHAVIFSTQDGKWMVEDLDSVNKTYLNNEVVHKAEIKTGDVLRITDYTLEINLEDDTIAEKPINLEDTMMKTAYGLEDTFTKASREPQVIVRRPDCDHAPDIRLPARRAKDFVLATEAICKADSLDEVLETLLSILARQFTPYHTWCALRSQPTGPMTCHAGKQRDGRSVELSEIKLNEKITQVVEEGQFLLMPRLPALRKEGIQSAMIAPIASPTDCFGVLYIDNATDQEQYGLADLDYLMLLAIHTAVILENF